MSITPTERDENLVFEVTIYRDGEVAESAAFETLQEAELFAEEWTERAPGVTYEIEDRSHDHTAWEAVAADTALDADYPPQEQ